MQTKVLKGITYSILLGVLSGCGGATTKAIGAQVSGPDPAIDVMPKSAVVSTNGTVAFAAAVTGIAGVAVLWSVGAPDQGSIDASGMYRAPASPGLAQVRAELSGLPAIFATAEVSIAAAGTPQAAYAAASSTCAGMPLRSTGTTYYFCDCQAGAQAGCIAGNDANPGTSPTAPKRTAGAANTAFGSLAAGDTVAFCRGGAWSTAGLRWRNGNCRAGTGLTNPANTSTCDIRDYTPSWGGVAKPMISVTGGNFAQFSPGPTQGVRILNLDLRTASNGWGVWLYSGTFSDFFICNNDFDGFGIAWNLQGAISRVTYQGNRVTNSGQDAFLGAASDLTIDSNYFSGNGSTNALDHTIYISEQEPVVTSTNLRILNNEIHSGGAPNCLGSIIVVHGPWQGGNIENNYINGRAGAGGGCWGIGLAAGYSAQEYFRDFTIRRNWVVGGGNANIFVGEAPRAVIENNVVVANQPGFGITAPGWASSAEDDVSTTQTIRNNTIYFPAGTTTGSVGIAVGYEGAGHVVANNSVTFAGTGATCFSTPLASGAYAFVGNNACSGGSWGTGYDATTHVTGDPLYGSPPNDFTPGVGSPLLGGADLSRQPAVDFTGKVRRSSSASDIGAIER